MFYKKRHQYKSEYGLNDVINQLKTEDYSSVFLVLKIGLLNSNHFNRTPNSL